MFATLLPHAHLVAIDDDLVVLDVRSDAYLCVPDAAAGWAAEQAGGSDVADSIGARLVAAGLATWTPTAAPSGAARALPSRNLEDIAPPPADWRAAARLVLAVGDLLRLYVRRPFGAILRDARSGRQAVRRPQPDDAELTRLCRQFERLVIWAPVPGKCLVRSFLLLRFLRRSGLDADWVFGVTTWPFAAHCWLQVGDMALDDAAERLSRYTPILAV